jgi:hypothetical protein
MSASIYTEKLVEPDEKMLTYDLAETKSHFNKIAEFIENEYGDFTIRNQVGFLKCLR